jgi:predicted RNA-binding Zn-ribbon protein involved in translation (DUF1610 family)
MPIQVTCSCGKTLTAPDAAAGKRAKCPGCGQVITVPAPIQEAELLGAAAAQDPYGVAEPSPAAASASAGGEQRQPCPECGEMIIVGAAKCRFCNAIFDPKLKQMGGGRSLELKQIAQYQRGLIFSVLGQIVAGVIWGMANASQSPPLLLVGALGLLVAGIAGLVFVVLCAMRLYSTGAAIALAILMFIPCVSLIVLLSINGKATNRLKENGIKVGFLGADMSQF